VWNEFITDNHMHIDPLHGLGLKAVKQFTSAGGTHIILVGKTARDWGIEVKNVDDFQNSYEKTIHLADIINSETDAKAYPIVGFHPSEFMGLAGAYGLEHAYSLGLDLLDILENLYEERRIYGIGEIGRPHFPVDVKLLDASNKLLMEYLKRAADLNCPVQLHTEHFTEEKFDELFVMVRHAGNPKKVIKHFSPPLPTKAQECGVTASIVSSKDAITTAIKDSPHFLMETDYIDDITRPGAVLGPKTVPKRTLQFIERGILSEEDAAYIHQDLISYLYGIDIG